MQNSNKLPYSVSLAASLFATTLILAFMYATQSLLVPLLFSILIAISLFPLASFLERIRLPRAVAAIVSVVVAIAIITLLGWFIIHQSIIIGKNASSITYKVLSVIERGIVWAEQTFNVQRNDLVAQVQEQGEKIMSNAGTVLTNTFGSISGLIAGMVMVPIFTFFLLYYRDFFREFFFKAFKSSSNKKVNDTLNKVYDVVQNYLLGLITVMGIVAILNTLGLIILGIEYAWFFGTLASLLMLLPYIGIAIGSILPALFALAVKDNAWYAIGVVAWFQVVQFLEGNIITPNIVGGKVSINPLMALITLLLGGMLFGLSGLILALPLTATIKVIFDAIPSMEAFGFLIGEPEKQHLKRNATQELLTKWGIVKKPKIKSKIQVDINVETDAKAADTTISYKEINESEEVPYTDVTSNKTNQKLDDK
ncbi:AI-2E family transporter [Sphingobacterium sp. UT-1RO-CII-1]|uniref:AI-2E family transporter n=1 Tax=Sphingobacterium sp. UT-1RO-CII-1 TaxID=2995225 RepID=UPI00227C4C1A|nr:AI-2E family transporter [Sphingobacterium sp. UT-1RO-CII-1]MCY4780217.1 AI-2E family transporter [Sphingobacterium sp. UT-1RO-CII-1]